MIEAYGTARVRCYRLFRSYISSAGLTSLSIGLDVWFPPASAILLQGTHDDGSSGIHDRAGLCMDGSDGYGGVLQGRTIDRISAQREYEIPPYTHEIGRIVQVRARTFNIDSVEGRVSTRPHNQASSRKPQWLPNKQHLA